MLEKELLNEQHHCLYSDGVNLFPVCMQSVVAELKLGLDRPKLSTHQNARTLESHDYLVQLVACLNAADGGAHSSNHVLKRGGSEHGRDTLTFLGSLI